MKSKSLIEKQLHKKKNSELVKTIIAAKKNKEWISIAQILSSPRKMRINVNLEKINNETKNGETIVIIGKVLSDGEVNKKIKVVALGFSQKAKEKLLNSKCEVLSILDEIKKNPQAKDVRILKWKQRKSKIF